jgi:hypothetical protein
MLLVKPINPSKFNSNVFMDEFTAEANSISADILLDFELTTATWKHKVKFERLVQIGPAEIVILVGTDDTIYGYVTKGTKKHIIKPRPENKRGLLFFNRPFVPKTKPGKMVASVGYIGPDLATARQVKHPGNEARKFDEQIQKKWRPIFKKRVEAAIKRAVKKSNYAFGD